MAADANMGDAAPAAAAEVLESIKPPVGVIIPPPGEIREAIEKTAGYVMRGGLGLEARIRDNHGANPKFSFLMSSSDPYNAYYEWRKDEIKAGRGNAVSAGRVGEAAIAPAKQEPKGPGKPPDFQFSPRMPRMSQVDLEVVRLTALFVAKNGRQFMTQLAQREAGNPQYQFLIPNHTFHNFFQSMVDQYSLLVREGGVNGEGTKARQERAAELQRMVDDKFYVLGRAKQRAEYAKWLEAEKKKKEEEEEKTQIEFARIDWNDFVVVETIVFNESDEQAALPPPTSLNELQYASLEEKNKMSVSANLRIEEAFPFDDMGSTPAPQTYSSAAAPVQSQHAPPTVTASYGPVAPAGGYNGYAQPAANPRAAQAEEEAQQRIQEREQARLRMQQAQTEAKGGAGPMKIRENYVPRAAAKAANRTEMAICPNCKQQIPINELQEHMRIELLDPRWKEQRNKAEARTTATNFVTADAAANLKRLASQRSDIFDSVAGQYISEDEAARRKRAAVASGPTGTPEVGSLGPPSIPLPPAQAPNINIEDQLRAIREKARRAEVGP